ncbi:MAG: hypothetical protein IJT49_10035 [Clostridia bacterium]|nr:hypothetical protein [Clostridia bacterium]
MNNRSNNIVSKKKFRNILIIVTAICVISIVLGFVTVSLFTSSLQAQRTIAAYDTEGDRFSSNLLLKSSSKDNVRTEYTTNTTMPVTAVVTLCNYQQGMQTLPFPDEFTYTLTARLVKYNETSVPPDYVEVNSSYISVLESSSQYSYTVTVNNGTSSTTLGSSTNVSGTFSGSFAKNQQTGKMEGHTDSYTISFSTDFITDPQNLYLELIAEPPSNSPLPVLRGIIKPELRAAGASNLWTGTFRDDKNVAPNSYDGYNYLITGTGSGTVTVTWNSTKVVLSEVSKNTLLSIPEARQIGDSITFPVDSDDESRYDLQFYKVDIPTGTMWNVMDSYVTFNFS